MGMWRVFRPSNESRASALLAPKLWAKASVSCEWAERYIEREPQNSANLVWHLISSQFSCLYLSRAQSHYKLFQARFMVFMWYHQIPIEAEGYRNKTSLKRQYLFGCVKSWKCLDKHCTLDRTYKIKVFTDGIHYWDENIVKVVPDAQLLFKLQFTT